MLCQPRICVLWVILYSMCTKEWCPIAGTLSPLGLPCKSAGGKSQLHSKHKRKRMIPREFPGCWWLFQMQTYRVSALGWLKFQHIICLSVSVCKRLLFQVVLHVLVVFKPLLWCMCVFKCKLILKSKLCFVLALLAVETGSRTRKMNNSNFCLFQVLFFK